MYAMKTMSGAMVPATWAAAVTGQVGVALAALASAFIVAAVPQLLRRTKKQHRP
jgi:hypothetical protein